MRRHPNDVLRTIILLSLLAAQPAAGGVLPFFDDFEDGAADDGSPVTWLAGIDGDARREVVDGDYHVYFSGPASSYIAESSDLRDVSIRTQLRFLSSPTNTYASVFVRGPTRAHYFGGIFASGELALGECDESLQCTWNSYFSDLDPRNEDVLLKLDAKGDQFSLTAWREGSPMPSAPQLVMQDATLPVGPIGVGFNGFNSQSTVAVRWVEAVPEPCTIILTGTALAGVVASRYRKRGRGRDK